MVHFFHAIGLETWNSENVEPHDWKGVGIRPVAKPLEFTEIQVFWDVTPCRLVKLQTFRRIVVPSSSGSRRSVAYNVFNLCERKRFQPAEINVLSTTVLLRQHRHIRSLSTCHAGTHVCGNTRAPYVPPALTRETPTPRLKGTYIYALDWQLQNFLSELNGLYASPLNENQLRPWTTITDRNL